MDKLYLRIENLCKERNINITSMCKNADVPRSALSDYKAGRIKSLSADKLLKIAKYFNVSVDYLLGGTDDPVNYENGELIASIPLSYMEACDGDVRRAWKLMEVVDKGAQEEKPATETSDELDNEFFAFYGEVKPYFDEDDINDIKIFMQMKAEYKKKKNDKG